MEMLNIAETLQNSTVYAHGHEPTMDNEGVSESFSDTIRQEILGNDTNAKQTSGRGEEELATDQNEDGDTVSDSEAQAAILWVNQIQNLPFMSAIRNLRNGTTGLEVQQIAGGTAVLSQTRPDLEKGTQIADVQKAGIPKPVVQDTENQIQVGTKAQAGADQTMGTVSSAAAKVSVSSEVSGETRKTEISSHSDVPVSEKKIFAPGTDQNAAESQMNRLQQDILSQAVISQSRMESGLYTGMQQTESAVQSRGTAVTSDLQGLFDTMLKQMSQGKTEFEILLEPANLGKLIIKVAYESGKAAVSILCTNDKTLEMLSQNAKNMGAIMEQRMGTETTVVVEARHANPDYLQQQAEQDSRSGYERDGRQEEQKRKKENEYISFAEQLRLGLM